MTGVQTCALPIFATFGGLGGGNDPEAVQSAVGMVFGLGLIPAFLTFAATVYLVRMNSRSQRG